MKKSKIYIDPLANFFAKKIKELDEKKINDDWDKEYSRGQYDAYYDTIYKFSNVFADSNPKVDFSTGDFLNLIFPGYKG